MSTRTLTNLDVPLSKVKTFGLPCFSNPCLSVSNQAPVGKETTFSLILSVRRERAKHEPLLLKIFII